MYSLLTLVSTVMVVAVNSQFLPFPIFRAPCSGAPFPSIAFLRPRVPVPFGGYGWYNGGITGPIGASGFGEVPTSSAGLGINVPGQLGGLNSASNAAFPGGQQGLEGTTSAQSEGCGEFSPGGSFGRFRDCGYCSFGSVPGSTGGCNPGPVACSPGPGRFTPGSDDYLGCGNNGFATQGIVGNLFVNPGYGYNVNTVPSASPPVIANSGFNSGPSWGVPNFIDPSTGYVAALSSPSNQLRGRQNFITASNFNHFSSGPASCQGSPTSHIYTEPHQCNHYFCTQPNPATQGATSRKACNGQVNSCEKRREEVCGQPKCNACNGRNTSRFNR